LGFSGLGTGEVLPELHHFKHRVRDPVMLVLLTTAIAGVLAGWRGPSLAMASLAAAGAGWAAELREVRG